MVRPEFSNVPVLNVLPDIPQIYTSSTAFSFILDSIILGTLFAALFAPLGRMIFKDKETQTMGQRFGAVLGLVFGVSAAFALSGAGLTLFEFWATALLAALFFALALYKIMTKILGDDKKVLAGIIAFIIAWVLMDSYLITTELEVVRNVFGFLSLLAPIIFLVAALYLIQQKWKKGAAGAEPGAAAPSGPGLLSKLGSMFKGTPKTPEEIGGEIKIEKAKADDAVKSLTDLLASIK